MVYNCFIECQVCHCITKIRLQVGFLDQHPIVVTCGKCGISLNGKVQIGQEKPQLKFKFDNADIIEDNENADFIVECSGEFPVKKFESHNEVSPFQYSPFILNTMRMREKYNDFLQTIYILNNANKVWVNSKRILDLYCGEKKTYLRSEIWKILHKNDFPCNNDLEILRAVHMIEIHHFIRALRDDLLNESSLSNDILKLDWMQIKELINFLSNHEGYSLESMQEQIYKIYDEFISIYPFLIPAIAIQFYNEGEIDYNLEGSTTSTLDMVKQFSLDVYETLGNLFIIPVALNNIEYRKEYKKCIEQDGESIDLEKFIKFTKAKKFHYYDNDEKYTKELRLILNSKLRNAIGHNDITYDSISQIITYVPDPRNRTKKETIYLLEFENEIVHLFQGLLVISEYLYRIREIDLIFKGNLPKMC